MENGRQFDVNLYQRRIGEKVTIEYLRHGETRALDVPVVERANDPARLADLVRPQENLIPTLGLLVVDLDGRVAAMLPQLRSRSEVVVVARAVNGPAWQNAFNPGDVIYAINGVRIRQLSELRSVTEKLSIGDAVVVQVQRGAELQYIPFEID